MTGLTLDQFQTLTTRLTPLWAQAERTRLSQRKRQHAIGQGTKYKLATIADKLLCVLAFSRFALTDELLGWLVGLDASTVCRLQQRLEPLLEQAADPTLGLSLRRRLPPGAKKIVTVEELLRVCPEFAEIMTDATEQPRRRPPRRTQRRWDSGKRKRHTINTQITVNTAGRMLLVSDSVPGCVQDSALFKRAGTADRVPRGARHDLDRGYHGAPTDYPDAHVIVPVKKRRNHRRLTRVERGGQPPPGPAADHRRARPLPDEEVPDARPGLPPSARGLHPALPQRRGLDQLPPSACGGVNNPGNEQS